MLSPDTGDTPTKTQPKLGEHSEDASPIPGLSGSAALLMAEAMGD
jgi:hypothetical protein